MYKQNFRSVSSLLILACLLLSACSRAAKPEPLIKTDAKDSPFEFRALCTPSNMEPQKWGIVATHNVDNDWGLWGHNIWKVLGKNPDMQVYATINGEKDKSQYCFSSPILYKTLENWIIDQWGMKGGRFTIMPADNKKVCQCVECIKKGCTPDNATPAVASVMTRLAKKFPGHQFFLTAYHTTLQPPTQPMPKNAGVMLSTMSIPMRYTFQENKGFKKFDDLLHAWKKVTPLIYVWEYDRNFDDYISPYPCLFVMQQRFKYFREAGIKGIFVNGSGEDYSSFDNVQSFVLAQLMIDPDADVESLVRTFFEKYYPVCGKFIADYYMILEYRLKDTNHIMPYYGTIDEEIASYLDKEAFIDFWVNLDKKSKSVKGPERQLLNQMLTAFAYTRLQLKPSEDDRAEMRLILQEYESVPRLKNYKETNGSLKDYLKK